MRLRCAAVRRAESDRSQRPLRSGYKEVCNAKCGSAPSDLTKSASVRGDRMSVTANPTSAMTLQHMTRSFLAFRDEAAVGEALVSSGRLYCSDTSSGPSIAKKKPSWSAEHDPQIPSRSRISRSCSTTVRPRRTLHPDGPLAGSGGTTIRCDGTTTTGDLRGATTVMTGRLGRERSRGVGTSRRRRHRGSGA